MTLDPLVDARWAAAASPGEHLVLPDGCVDLIDRDHRVLVVGPMTRAHWVRLSTGPMRGLRLHPGSTAWLGVPLDALRDQVVPLEELGVRVPQPVDHPDRLAAVLAYARRRLRRDPRVLQVSRRLMADPARPIERLAGDVGWTPRHLRRRFVAEIGLSPRRFARVARLRRLVETLRRDEPLGTVAHMHGFTDQAHMCRDVRGLTGLSPSALREVLGS